MKPAANQSGCPRLSEAGHLLPLLRAYLEGAAPRTLAIALDLVPIVEDGLFGYELVPDRDVRTCPIIGRNAQGEPVLRKISSRVGSPSALRLVAGSEGPQSRRGCAARPSVQQRDTPYANWLAAAESAWAHFPMPCADLPRTSAIVRENTHRSLDGAIAVAHSHLNFWDPFIEFLGLPNEAQLGFVLSGTDGERGILMFHQPDTWTLRWSAPPAVVKRSWSPKMRDVEAGNDWAEGYRISTDRRAHCRRTTDRGGLRESWATNDRRQRRGRRMADRHATIYPAAPRES